MKEEMKDFETRKDEAQSEKTIVTTGTKATTVSGKTSKRDTFAVE